MKKIQYSIYKKDTGDAGGKAKNDAFDILSSNGFTPSYSPSRFQIIRVIQQLLSVHKLSKSDCILIQYPAVHEKLLNEVFIRCSNVKYRIALIHDIRTLQGFDGQLQKEINRLGFFNYLVVHNAEMEKIISKNGYTGTIIQIGIFDYLHDYTRNIEKAPYSGSICFAGNLDKSLFLSQLDKVNNYTFKLYGINNNQDFTNINNISYYGSLPSDEIVYKLSGDYGLVWDGDSIETCNGKYGEYLLFNSPHKLSAYLAAGKPIITWKKAAIAQFVIENRVGIVVDSLLELNDIDLKEQYDTYKSNVQTIKRKLSIGGYLVDAVNQIKELNNT